MTEKLALPIRDEIFTLVGLDGSVGVFLVISLGLILVKQRRAQARLTKMEMVTDDNRNDYIRISHNETNV